MIFEFEHPLLGLYLTSEQNFDYQTYFQLGFSFSFKDGYDDIYMDGDYDYDRYDRDSDYADGVDDAMDEFDEDW